MEMIKMKKIIVLAGVLGLIWASIPVSVFAGAKSVYDFTMKDLGGKAVPLSQFRGQALLIVNVASKCGLTPQYKGLQEIYSRYKGRDFVILGFPANNFKEQEPGTNEQIKEFCTRNYGVEFPMFAKISVLGDDIHPLYRFLTDKENDPTSSGEIRWNFDKFLVDKKGNIINRFHPRVTPTDPVLIQAVEKALK
jgi:glutathione peroxidase